MEFRADPESRPHHLRQTPSSRTVPVAIGSVLAIALAGATYWWLDRESVPVARPALPESAPQPGRQPTAPAAKHVPVPPQDGGVLLPTLELSDTMLRGAISGLVGGGVFGEYFFQSGIVRRIVATVDNLPRDAAPRRMFPVRSLAGRLITTGNSEAIAIDLGNAARYAAYLKILDSVDTEALVQTYVRLYPLFQRAYEDLGFPGRYFNDRLIECIDDLLAAPEVAPPVRLVQQKVLYEFADPELETASAGRKILIRMGAQGAARVKAKLRELRRAILAASTRRR